ncbi:hypothetical protein KM915_03655 [Cytobacillus oceanisediminis]|uniref:hypothetical protein n=1 Tax=Cytobacillus oceanisediminis TaxID=665099 RepID=UPI001C22B01F|nr:hypothetical protein [Cytobacillus oceanisediminis]MBU8729151.1 hypothetical protein [Cytobacillus oceanisediminis]
MINLKSKGIWFTDVAFLLAPVMLNFLVFYYRSERTNGSKDQWLSFLGNYTGGIISAFVAYISHNGTSKDSISELTRVKQEHEESVESRGGIIKDLEEKGTVMAP